MQGLIVEYLAMLLESPAFNVEMQNVETLYRSGTTVNALDTNGVTYPLILNKAMSGMGEGFKKVTCSEPTVKPQGPFPVVFVYHITSEYKDTNQEALLRWGQHRIGISIYAGGATPEDAELAIKRVGRATKKIIERNQYMFAQIPGMASTVAYIESEISGQHLPSIIIPYHMICVVVGRELRNS